ncbi:MAG TPA: hypothetical protein VHT73_09995 [Thermodesulfobacteriota bacterium]|nr:hypothetical protein [Thermodesulfobacteriota bacterium]
MKRNIKEVRTLMAQISSKRGNPLGIGTIESFLAPFEILTLVALFPIKHVQFLLGLDINVVVNTTKLNSVENRKRLALPRRDAINRLSTLTEPVFSRTKRTASEI